ncbi:GEVED domain-containing protein [Cytophaga aurantiaca]|uniref:GEVED domain-containing protein n=1 Tax=Cytophaga aurantiaca TaxID=29530 RepID=UPI0003816705|nr:GEVED domain-containing protein [Cytophaga aurantiaca]
MKSTLLIFAKLQVVLLFLLISRSSIAQNCGVGDEFHEVLKQYNTNLRTTSISPVNGILYIPITIHQVRHTNGTFSKNNSLEPFYHSLISLNRVFSEVHIQFYVNKNIDYIDNDAYLLPTLDGAVNQQLITNYKNANTANVWILDGWSDSQADGKAGPGGVQLAGLSERTVIHEFGHFFTLMHTFDTVNGVEKVARTGGNCATAGDGLCDTHADPYGLTTSQIIGNVVTYKNCTVTSNTRDLNNEVYTPPFDNFMSYYDNECGLKFTPQQYDRMVASIPIYHSAYTEMQGAGIAGAPSALNIVSNVGYSEIAWTNNSGSIGTIVEYSTDGGTSWSVMNGVNSTSTKTVLSNIFVGKTYLFRARHLNSITYSANITYTPTISHPFIPIVVVSKPTDFYSIGGVSITNTNLDNQTNIQEDYTIHAYSPVPNFFIGGSFNLNLKIKTIDHGGGNIGVGATYMFVYLDENGDGDFDDIGEVKYQETQSAYPLTLTIPVSISSQATTGYKRLRIRSFSQYANPNPYAMYAYGETEDYILNVIADSPSISALTAQFNTSNQTVALAWTDLINNYNYVIERSSDGINFTAIKTTTSSLPSTFIDTDVAPNTQYAYRVKHVGGALYSPIADVFSNDYPLKYCTPLSSNGCSGTGGTGIDEFAIPSISFVNNSTDNCGFSGGGYSNEYPNKTIALSAGQNYSFTVKNNYFGGVNFFDLYLDINQNGTFETSERLVNNIASGTTWAYKNGTFTVPASSLNGATKLRIRSYANSIDGACGSSAYGETEDYKVIISGGTEVPVINPVITNVTQNSISVSWASAASPLPLGYKIQISTDGIVYSIPVNLSTSQTSYTFAGLVANSKYFIQIISAGATTSATKKLWTQTLSLTTAIADEEITKNVAYVYPNPVSGILTIKANGVASLFNSVGQAIRSEFISESGYWDMNGLASGVYFLHIQNENQTQVLKIIKQ